MLFRSGRPDAALKSYEKAIAIKSDFAEAYRNLGSVLLDLRRMDEALVSFERALAINPDLDFILGNLLHTKMHLCDWDDVSSRLDELQNKINNSEKVIEPFSMLGLIDDPEIQRKTTEIFANKKFQKSSVLQSYGIQVAKLAGIPDAVIDLARRELAILEEQSPAKLVSNKASASSAKPDQTELYLAPVSSAVEKRIDSLRPDELSPKQALDLIYELKKLR